MKDDHYLGDLGLQPSPIIIHWALGMEYWALGMEYT